jgi:hypothetical protein
MSSTHRHLLLDFFWQVISGPPCILFTIIIRSSATILVDAGGDILSLKRHGGWKSTTVAESYVEESIANKISISNKILGIGENQPSTSSTTRAENEMGTSSQLPSTAKSSQPQVPNSLPKIIVKNCTNCKMDVHIGKN